MFRNTIKEEYCHHPNQIEFNNSLCVNLSSSLDIIEQCRRNVLSDELLFWQFLLNGQAGYRIKGSF